jgi:uncharacterized protein YndB with AHSA1/START domain
MISVGNAAGEPDPKLDFAIEGFIDAPPRLVREALTKPEHLKEWYMPKAWGRVTRAELDVRPGGNFSVDIAAGDGPDAPNLGCFLDVVPMERLVWTSMLFPGYRPAVFDDIPITAIVTMGPEGTGTRYVFTALHRNEAVRSTGRSLRAPRLLLLEKARQYPPNSVSARSAPRSHLLGRFASGRSCSRAGGRLWSKRRINHGASKMIGRRQCSGGCWLRVTVRDVCDCA